MTLPEELTFVIQLLAAGDSFSVSRTCSQMVEMKLLKLTENNVGSPHSGKKIKQQKNSIMFL